MKMTFRNMKKIFVLISTALLVIAEPAHSQSDILFSCRYLSFEEYMTLVSSQNLEYAAEKFNVTISEAAIEVAKIFPDPYISFAWTENLEEGSRKGYGYSSEIGTTIELGAKRKTRIDLAKSEYDLSKALLSDYFRNLQSEASLVYLDALKKRELYKVGDNSYQTMKQLSEADSLRFQMGSIMRIDAIQSKLEAGILYNDLVNLETEWKNSLSQLTYMTGISINDTLFMPSSHLQDTCRIFSCDNLIEEALNNRADLVAALISQKVSQNKLDLAMKNRKTDIDLNLGVSDSYLLAGLSPAATSITGGIEIPLKFSNIYKGEIKMSQSLIRQSEKLFHLAELLIRNEITQAWNLYYFYCSQVDNFENGLLKMASDVLNGKIYSYQRGETSLLEVLNAQRTFNEIQSAYYEALFNRAAALVNLEKSAGIWDINL
jgi:cobalt-zinc-cadmium efflux system outer membrane protein